MNKDIKIEIKNTIKKKDTIKKVKKIKDEE